jgi:hypothetical protein
MLIPASLIYDSASNGSIEWLSEYVNSRNVLVGIRDNSRHLRINTTHYVRE